ncbi:hypothetical protein TNIN_486581 [Trichonephila inaurata madagascariensis]|uniref:Uncharacterized protein n=1 Tax=Trichonephila inaurata madagascariensis TaxID=2747483 RepID=A0A8X6YCL2_9ARAC|nr:hypothetical protein TNIN_486581 [Trichonephila inaurata madagascariensis]
MVVAQAVDARNRGAIFFSCGQYNGQTCFNASRYESDLNEDCTFYPEILQDFEKNILGDENNENELEILKRLEDNGEEEEKKN